MLRVAESTDAGLATRLGISQEELSYRLALARHERAEAVASMAHAVIRGVAGLFKGVAESFRRRAAYDELNGLDDRMLRDMGLNRGELWAAVDGSARQEPSNDNAAHVAANDDAPRRGGSVQVGSLKAGA